MYQAGVKNITLYENKGISFDFWDSLDFTQISNIGYGGDVITIENLQRPEFDIEETILNSGLTGSSYKLKFLLFGLLSDNQETIENLVASIYGFVFLVEFYDGTFKFYNTPIFFKDGKIKPHNEMTYEINLETVVPSVQKWYNYTPGITTSIFRFDTTLLTFDNEIYTWDYDQ